MLWCTHEYDLYETLITKMCPDKKSVTGLASVYMLNEISAKPYGLSKLRRKKTTFIHYVINQIYLQS